MKHWLKLIVIGLFGMCVSACGGGGEGRGADDLEHAIFMLGERRKAEENIIKEQNQIILQLKANQEKANSQGMIDKLAKDIQMSESVIQKAKVNIANQDTIILQLQAKLDSIKALP